MTKLIPKKVRARPVDPAQPQSVEPIVSYRGADTAAMTMASNASWEIHPVPAMRTVLPLDIRLSRAEAIDMRLGFVPDSMGDRWFAYFEGDVLHIHGSCTGFAIWFVRFKETIDDGLSAYEVEVNRDAEQYQFNDDISDVEAVTQIVRDHLPSWRSTQTGAGRI